MLKPKKKLARKKIKEDKLLTTMNQVVDFINENSKIIIMCLAGLALIIVIGYFVIKSKKEANVAASGRLILAVDQYNSQQFQEAIPTFLQITEQFNGTNNAGISCYYLANSYYYQGNYAEAKKYFNLYLDDYSDNRMFESTAFAGLASCFAQEGFKGEAAKLYQKAAEKNKDLFTAADYLFAAALNYIEIDQKESAKELLQKIVTEYENSTKANDAKLLLAELTIKS